MSHERIAVSAVVAVVAVVSLSVAFLVIPMTSHDKAESVVEMIAGQASRPVGAVLMVRDVVEVAGVHGCNAYLLSQAMDAFRRGRWEEAMELDQRRFRCFRVP